MTKAIQILVLFLFIFQSLQQLSLADDDDDREQEAFDFLGIQWNPDGTLNRSSKIPMVDPPTVLFHDIDIINVRLYSTPLNPSAHPKIPLIVFFHGGGFVLYSASTSIYHDFCIKIASTFPAVVVSVDYSLAPESRLPWAYSDAESAILWLRTQATNSNDRFPLLEYANFSKVYLVGSGAGANIAYNVGLRVVDSDLSPLQIKGLILNQPFFGGVKRTESEINLQDDVHLPLFVNDVLWTLALPDRADRDHDFSNPIASATCDQVKKLPEVYIIGYKGDPLYDRALALSEFLRSCKIRVSFLSHWYGYHGIEFENDGEAEDLIDHMKNFVFGEFEDLSKHPQVSYL